MSATTSASVTPQASVSPTGSVKPTAAAKACAAHHHPGVLLGQIPAARLAALATCTLRKERAQLGLGFQPSQVVSQMTAAALHRFVGLAYLADHNSQAADQAEAVAAANARTAVCHTPTSGTSRVEWAFAEIKFPSDVTTVSVAKLLATELAPTGAVARESNAVFGVATRPGLLFEHNNLNGRVLGVIAVSCP